MYFKYMFTFFYYYLSFTEIRIYKVKNKTAENTKEVTDRKTNIPFINFIEISNKTRKTNPYSQKKIENQSVLSKIMRYNYQTLHDF